MSQSVPRLDALSRQLYRVRVEHPRLSVDELAALLSVSPQEVTARQQQLAELRLLQPTADGAWAVRNPDVAADRLLLTAEEQVAKDRRRIAEARAELSTLTADYLEARRLTSISGQIEVVPGLDNVRVAIDDLSGLSCRSIDTMAPGGGQRYEALEAALPLDLAALERGVRVRTMFQHSARTDPRTAEYADTLTQRGGHLRSAGTFPTRMIVYDEEAVLLPLHHTQTGAGAVIVRDRAVVTVFCAVFERHWQDGTDFGLLEQPDEGGPGELDLAVLRLLAAGKKDEVVARQIGMSLRSTRRLVAALMVRLGADSRFQAGARAVARGWIDVP